MAIIQVIQSITPLLMINCPFVRVNSSTKWRFIDRLKCRNRPRNSLDTFCTLQNTARWKIDAFCRQNWSRSTRKGENIWLQIVVRSCNFLVRTCAWFFSLTGDVDSIRLARWFCMQCPLPRRYSFVSHSYGDTRQKKKTHTRKK